MTVNLFGDHASFKPIFKAMRKSFGFFMALPELRSGNSIAIAADSIPAFD